MADTQLVKQFLEHRDMLMGFIYALTRHYDVAEEVFQEVSLAILTEAGKSTEVENFMPWAREVARRRVADYFRRAARRQSVEQLSDSLTNVICHAFTENDSLVEIHQERMKSLLECLKRLSGRSREVVEGHYHERQSLKQIAAAIGWTEGSVKVALSRARKALADCIQIRMHRPTQEAKQA
jgi:RNA polymerase sigma-70 factor (ECF subfamily)